MDLQKDSLEDALMVLSKASPEAVCVERTNQQKNIYKSYLYIETDVERDFRKILESLHPGQILFHCGSSGDGKSEIITRYSSKPKHIEKIDFHLDATHSFKPNQTAVEALDARFKRTLESQRPLVIGINIGMLGNYAKDGSDELPHLKEVIAQFLDGRKSHISDNFIFIDFEDYPKFMFKEDGFSSSFVEPFLKKLTDHSESNPFYQLYQQDFAQFGHTYLEVAPFNWTT